MKNYVIIHSGYRCCLIIDILLSLFKSLFYFMQRQDSAVVNSRCFLTFPRVS